MKPVWKRHSQEQRLCKVPKQEAVPQHGDDIEVTKIPLAKGIRHKFQDRGPQALAERAETVLTPAKSVEDF